MTDANGASHHAQLGFVILGAYAIGMLIIVLAYRNVVKTRRRWEPYERAYLA